jgi:hypothetical protein
LPGRDRVPVGMLFGSSRKGRPRRNRAGASTPVPPYTRIASPNPREGTSPPMSRMTVDGQLKLCNIRFMPGPPLTGAPQWPVQFDGAASRSGRKESRRTPGPQENVSRVSRHARLRGVTVGARWPDPPSGLSQIEAHMAAIMSGGRLPTAIRGRRFDARQPASRAWAEVVRSSAAATREKTDA